MILDSGEDGPAMVWSIGWVGHAGQPPVTLKCVLTHLGKAKHRVGVNREVGGRGEEKERDKDRKQIKRKACQLMDSGITRVIGLLCTPVGILNCAC